MLPRAKQAKLSQLPLKTHFTILTEKWHIRLLKKDISSARYLSAYYYIT